MYTRGIRLIVGFGPNAIVITFGLSRDFSCLYLQILFLVLAVGV